MVEFGMSEVAISFERKIKGYVLRTPFNFSVLSLLFIYWFAFSESLLITLRICN